MNAKKIFAGLLVSSLTLASSIQLYATALSNESIKTNMVYTIAGSSSTTQPEVAEIYNQKCFDVLKDYFNITRDQLPQDAKFNISIKSKNSLDQEEAHWTNVCEQEFSQKKISQEEYNKRKAQIKDNYAGFRKQVDTLKHDIVDCQYITSDGAVYYVKFNADTKEPIFVMTPGSAEGAKIQANAAHTQTNTGVSEENDAIQKTNALKFLTEHQVNGIQNPEFIKVTGYTHNRMYFQDANDHSKLVCLYFDVYTHQVEMFNCDVDPSDMF